MIPKFSKKKKLLLYYQYKRIILSLKNLFLTAIFSYIVSLLLLNGLKACSMPLSYLTWNNKIEDYELFDYYLAYAHLPCRNQGSSSLTAPGTAGRK